MGHIQTPATGNDTDTGASPPSAGFERRGGGFKGLLIAGVLALGGALWGGLLSSGTDVFKDRIKPFIERVSCAAQDYMQRNTAPYRPTALVFHFQGDENDKVGGEIAQALADAYGLNVIRVCSEMSVPYGGDRDKASEALRDSVAEMFQKYDADIAVFGDARGSPDQSRMGTVTRVTVPILPELPEHLYKHFNPSNIREYVKSAAFAKDIIQAAEMTAMGSGCGAVLYVFCGWGQEYPARWNNDVEGLKNYLARLRHINVHFMNVVGRLEPDALASMKHTSNLRAALGLHLFIFHGVEVVEGGGRSARILDESEAALAIGDPLFPRRPRPGAAEEAPPTSMNRAQIKLERAIACQSFIEASSALRGFESWLAWIPPSNMSQPFFEFPPNELRTNAFMVRLSEGRAIALMRALSDGRPASGDIAQLLKRRQSEVEVFAGSIEKMLESDIPGSRGEEMRKYLKERLSQELELLRATPTSTPAQLAAMLKLNGRRAGVCS